MIDIRPIRGQAFTLRVYGSNACAANGDTYQAVLVVRQRGIVARVGPAHGELTRVSLREICDALYNMGVRVLRIRRAANHSIPRAQLVRAVGAFRLWELWL